MVTQDGAFPEGLITWLEGWGFESREASGEGRGWRLVSILRPPSRRQDPHSPPRDSHTHLGSSGSHAPAEGQARSGRGQVTIHRPDSLNTDLFCLEDGTARGSLEQAGPQRDKSQVCTEPAVGRSQRRPSALCPPNSRPGQGWMGRHDGQWPTTPVCQALP